MEKILLVLDALKPSSKAIDFACYIANLTHSKITGVFLENVLSNAPVNVLVREESEDLNGLSTSNNNDRKRNCFEKNIQNFNEACEKRSVLHAIHRDRGLPAPEIIEESRFADLVIIDPQTSFAKKYEGTPTGFVKFVLEKTECPVVLSPENFEGVDKIIFTYDGSNSAVFAIKQFIYLFREFKNKPAIVLQISKESDATIKEKYKLKEWLKGHYNSIEMKNLQGDSKYDLVDFIMNEKNIFLVMGAYSKNFISYFFRGSHADVILKTTDVPLFIAHR